MFVRLALLSLFISFPSFTTSIEAPEVSFLEKHKSLCVNLYLRAHSSAESSGFAGAQGTAFVLGKDATGRPVYVTNRHLSIPYHPSDITVEDHIGDIYKFDVLYANPFLDFGFLRLRDKETFPKMETPSFRLDVTNVEKVYLIGNDSGNNYTLHEGKLTEINELANNQHTYRATMPTRGGSSGSPWFDKDGNIIAINAMGNRSNTAYAIPIKYVLDAWDALKKNQTALPHYYLGGTYSAAVLGKYVRYAGFPQTERELHQETLKKTGGKVLVIKDTGLVKGAKLKSGDILWKVNNQVIAKDFLKLYKLLKASKTVKVTIFRAGKGFIDFEDYPVDTIDPLEEHEFLDLWGANISEEDPRKVKLHGASEYKLYVGHISHESPWNTAVSVGNLFLKLFGIDAGQTVIVSFNSKEVQTLKDLIQEAKALKADGLPLVTSSGKVETFKFLTPSSMDKATFWKRTGDFKTGFKWAREELKLQETEEVDSDDEEEEEASK